MSSRPRARVCPSPAGPLETSPEIPRQVIAAEWRVSVADLVGKGLSTREIGAIRPPLSLDTPPAKTHRRPIGTQCEVGVQGSGVMDDRSTLHPVDEKRQEMSRMSELRSGVAFLKTEIERRDARITELVEEVERLTMERDDVLEGCGWGVGSCDSA